MDADRRKRSMQIVQSDEEGLAFIEGALDLSHLVSARRQLKDMAGLKRLDLSRLTKLDSAGAMLLTQLAHKHITLENMQPQHEALYRQLSHTPARKRKKIRVQHILPALVVRIGKAASEAAKTTYELVVFLGRATAALATVVRHPSRLRIGEIVHHLEQIGINAVPIVGLIAFLISVVLAYQSTEQLRPLGAQQFTVNLITISVLREMGVLLTAIMVAGRSGSAFTAEIGVMKVREEIDALEAIGIDPFELLVVPRLIALIIALPLLTFVGDLMGLFGGAVLTKMLIGTSFFTYVDRVHSIAANGHALAVGMIKAPVFALFIGLVGCMHGMKVSGSAESVGTETTTSVVQSIFLVLVLDAMFSIFFQQVGL